jgi:hypothetical protein
MRNITQNLLKHWKTILIWAAGLTAGGIIAFWNNGLSQQARDLQITDLQPVNNWFFIVPNFVIMVALAIAGYLIGRKYDKNS